MHTMTKIYKNGHVTITVGNKVVGGINNIEWESLRPECNCGSKAAPGGVGHKPGCGWWMFADQWSAQKQAQLKAERALAYQLDYKYKKEYLGKFTVEEEEK